MERAVWEQDLGCVGEIIVTIQGKCVSPADVFYRIYPRDLENFVSATPVHSWPLTLENTMAVRQAFQLLDLSRKDVEDFWGQCPPPVRLIRIRPFSTLFLLLPHCNAIIV